MKHFLFVAVLIAFGAFSFGVMAQQLDDPTVKPLPQFLDDINKNETSAEKQAPQEDSSDIAAPESTQPQSDLSDIPDEFIIEASQFAEDCRNDGTMPKYYDCRCMAVAFLDKRIERGPEASASSIRNSITKECKDASGAAGDVYEHCLTDFENAPTHIDPEEFCSCYGNTYAETFERFDGVATAKVNVSLMARAKIICSDPVSARRMYGPGAVPRR